MTKVLSFSSGKGGVGKTTLVANLGSLWARAGRRTLLIDGDWTLGKLGITLGVRPKWTVEDVLLEKVSLAEAILPINDNLSLLASPSGSVGFEELPESARNQLFYEMEQVGRDYDQILFDHASGVHWAVLQFAAASHQHVIVTTPEPTSYTDAYAIMKLLSKRFAIREFCLIVTMSGDRKDTEEVIHRFSEVVRTHLDVRINLLDIFPWEPKLGESIRRQKAFVSMFPKEEMTAQFGRLCAKLDRAEPNHSHGLKFFYGQEYHATPLAMDEICPA